jgi:hypothetical protein
MGAGAPCDTERFLSVGRLRSGVRAEQGRAGDRQQPSLVPRCGSWRRLTPSVRGARRPRGWSPSGGPRDGATSLQTPRPLAASRGPPWCRPGLRRAPRRGSHSPEPGTGADRAQRRSVAGAGCVRRGGSPPAFGVRAGQGVRGWTSVLPPGRLRPCLCEVAGGRGGPPDRGSRACGGVPGECAAPPNPALEPTAPRVGLWSAGAVQGAAAHRRR